MKVSYLLFNSEMVQAILREIAASGTGKWQTRRIIKQQPGVVCFTEDVKCVHADGDDWMYSDIAGVEFIRCPYGQPGDLIYVRETFQCSDFPEYESLMILYRVDKHAHTELYERGLKWRPSIHMPRWASRITLEITSVRVERLQDITRADAAAEGVCLPDGATKPDWLRCDRWPEENFATLWDSIYSNWHDNPWVWVIEFKPHLVNVDAFIKQMEAA